MKLGKPGQFFFFTDFETTGIMPEAVPIEVGIVVADSRLNVVKTFDRLIDFSINEWTTPDQINAAKVHGIDPGAIALRGKPPVAVANEITGLCLTYPTSALKPRPVMISDNIQFEWQHMQRLFDAGFSIPTRVEDYFHYCGWDTSLLFEATGVVEAEHPHRALPDAMWLWQRTVEALRKTGTLANLNRKVNL